MLIKIMKPSINAMNTSVDTQKENIKTLTNLLKVRSNCIDCAKQESNIDFSFTHLLCEAF